MKKLDMQTPDLTEGNVTKIAKLFPNVITEKEGANGVVQKAVDFDLLRQALQGEIVEGDDERYRLDWPGKRASLLKANTPITNTLRPDRESSVNFDTTKNVFIEGDNFEVLKVLQESYLGKVKMIYIDPPYNTGKDFVYKDNFTKSKDEYEEEIGVEDEEGGKLFRNTDSNGRFHSDWLSMMYERLLIARDLLSEDGIIVVHIDENEYPNLEKILSEIFGEENNLGTVIWDKRNPKGEVVGVAQQHESITLYSKNKDVFSGVDFSMKKEHADSMLKKASSLIKYHGVVNELVKSEFTKWVNDNKNQFTGGELAYKEIDDNGNIFQAVSMAAPDKPETRSHRPLVHPVTNKPCPVPAKGWRFTDKSMDLLLEQGKILFGLDEKTQPRNKYLLKENFYESVSSLLYFGGSDDALSLPFDNPKPLYVVQKFIASINNKNGLFLDFFAGSATTAHAVMSLNAEDGGSRKFVMVQIPEEIEEDSEAYKAGYKYISDISKERIRRAGKKILEENAETLASREKPLDIGFRAYKADTTNMKDVYYHPSKVVQEDLFNLVSNIKEDRTPEDLLTQVILDLGLTLDLPIEKKELRGNVVYFVAGNALVACFDNKIDFGIVEDIAKHEPLKVVFKDASFKEEQDRTNVETKFKRLSPETLITVL